jgi:hypothetical protein
MCASCLKVALTVVPCAFHPDSPLPLLMLHSFHCALYVHNTSYFIKSYLMMNQLLHKCVFPTPAALVSPAMSTCLGKRVTEGHIRAQKHQRPGASPCNAITSQFMVETWLSTKVWPGVCCCLFQATLQQARAQYGHLREKKTTIIA